VPAGVRAGVPLDAQNSAGQTAMHFAYAYGYIRIQTLSPKLSTLNPKP